MIKPEDDNNDHDHNHDKNNNNYPDPDNIKLIHTFCACCGEKLLYCCMNLALIMEIH